MAIRLQTPDVPTAPVVGEKLWAVAATGHQVLCVTHMPQVAAFADCHYVVARAGETQVTVLDDDQRIEELARSRLAMGPPAVDRVVVLVGGAVRASMVASAR